MPHKKVDTILGMSFTNFPIFLVYIHTHAYVKKQSSQAFKHCVDDIYIYTQKQKKNVIIIFTLGTKHKKMK